MLLVKTRVSPVVLIEIDGSRRSFHRLKNRMTRIGSDPRSTLFVPESISERNLAVLEWDKGAVRIHNRSGHKFRLGESAILPGTSAEWPDRLSLEINDRLKMILALDPAKAVAAGSNDVDAIRLDDDSKPADSGTTMKLFLAAMLVGLLALSTTMETKNELDAMAVALEPLIVAADEPGPNRAVRREIAARLQIVQRQRLRTGAKDPQALAELRDFLKSLESESGRLPDKWFEDLRSFVLNQLASSR
ncbi:hypothetical protein GC170_12920 [bacterium]|nr:hypothetical protein [bacterium]